jgi:hypothetical protein
MSRTAFSFTMITVLATGCADPSEPSDTADTGVAEQNATGCFVGATLVPTYNGPASCLRTLPGPIYGANEDWHMSGSSVVGAPNGNQATEPKFDILLRYRYLGVPFVAIRCPNGAYLSADNGGGGAAHCNRSAVGDWETFRIQENGGSTAFETQNGHFLQMPHNSGPLEAVATWVGKTWDNSWEVFGISNWGELCQGPQGQNLCPMEAGRWL